jgi:hypothetical protein
MLGHKAAFLDRLFGEVTNLSRKSASDNLAVQNGEALLNNGVPDPPDGELMALWAIIEHGTIRAAATALGLSPHVIDSRLDNLRWRTDRRYLHQIVAYAAAHGWLVDQYEKD